MAFRKPMVTALAILSLALPAATTTVAMFAASPAVAKDNGKSNGNRGAKRQAREDKGANRGSERRGAPNPRSELKGANASNASATALAHASDNSRVGAARAYRDAAVETSTAQINAEIAQKDVQDFLVNYPGYTSAQIQEQIDALLLDPEYDETDAEDMNAFLSLQEQFKIAESFEADLLTLQTTANTLTGIAEGLEGTEEAALLALTDGRTLSPEALAILRANLGL